MDGAARRGARTGRRGDAARRHRGLRRGRRGDRLCLDRDVRAVIVEARGAVAGHELQKLQRALGAGDIGRKRDRKGLRPRES